MALRDRDKEKKKCFVVLIRRELPSMFPVKREKKSDIPIDHKFRRDKLTVRSIIIHISINYRKKSYDYRGLREG